MLNDNELDKVILEAHELLNEHKILVAEIGELLVADRVSDANQKELECDCIYHRYWDLLHSNFDKKILDKATTINHANDFLSTEYLNVLKEIYKELPREICTYKGYVLKRAVSCFGSICYFVYCNNSQYSDGLDFYSDEGAMKSFKRAIDENPGNPDFNDY